MFLLQNCAKKPEPWQSNVGVDNVVCAISPGIPYSRAGRFVCGMSSHVTLHAGRWIINMDNLTMTDEDLVASQAEARRRNTLLEEHGVDVEDKGTSDHAPLDYVEDEAHSRARPSGEPPRLDLFVEENHLRTFFVL